MFFLFFIKCNLKWCKMIDFLQLKVWNTNQDVFYHVKEIDFLKTFFFLSSLKPSSKCFYCIVFSFWSNYIAWHTTRYVKYNETQ